MFLRTFSLLIPHRWRGNCRVRRRALSVTRTLLAKDHLQITASMFRHTVTSDATVVHVAPLSSHVRQLLLRVHDETFHFHAGQWVDMSIPGSNLVGGYSICSAPHTLHTDRLIELAVKKSSWPPAVWVHDTCAVGSRVQIRAGGNFFYCPSLSHGATPSGSSTNATGNLPLAPMLLIAGGVGVNPLVSVLRHRRHLLAQNNTQASASSIDGAVCRAVLLFSARTEDDLLFRDELTSIASASGVDVRFFVTREKAPEATSAVTSAALRSPRISYRRMSLADLTEAVESLTITAQSSTNHRPNLSCYVCGPRTLIDDSVFWLCSHLNISSEHVHHERWT